MRNIILIVTAILLSISSQNANAKLAMAFDDPDTQGIDLLIEDDGTYDVDKIEGRIEFCAETPPLLVCASGNSKPIDGSSSTAPQMSININFIRYTGAKLDFMVTDTDFNVGGTTGEARAHGWIEGGDTLEYKFFGDTNNQPFGRGFEITSFGPYNSPDFTINGKEDVTTGAFGSMTILLEFRGSGDSRDEFNAAPIASINLVATADNVEVPNVVGMTQGSAESAIEGAGLKVGSVTTQSSSSVPAGSVIDQDPDAGASVAPASSVNLLVSAGAAPTEISNPDALSGSWYDPVTDGEGYLVINSTFGMYLYYFGHDENGNRLWLVSSLAQGPFSYGQSLELILYSGTGTYADPSPELTEWGTLVIIFDNCGQARVYMNGRDGEKSADTVKIAGVGELDCGS